MKINVLTLFPEMIAPVVETSILGRAVKKGILEVNIYNIRDYSREKHKRVDDYPFGGGVGMVMMADPIFRCINETGCTTSEIIYMSPRGKIIDMEKIMELSEKEEITILCGHYEGIDQRVLDHYSIEELSIGDYILTGGELAALVLIDAVSRFVPEVLGTKESATEESIYSGLLEYPQYTQPRSYEEMNVPEVLLNGNHKLIHLWKFEESLKITKERRPDLLARYLEHEHDFSKDEMKIVKKISESL